MSLGEFTLIDRYFKRAPRAGAGVTLGIGDDAALLEVPAGCELVAAIDSIVEGRHFLTGTDPAAIAHRALAVNLSDLAAMGATPAWALLALTLPDAQESWLERFAAGWFALADRHGVELVGGDTTRGPLTISVQLSGFVERGTALRRSGARAGDLLVVTGTLGDAAAGLALARAAHEIETMTPGAAAPGVATPDATATGAAAELRERFDYPTPRVELGCAARGLATACMDLSDGLSGDLPKLAQASGVAAHVELDRLPISQALRSAVALPQARQWAVSGGDDYELLLAVPHDRLPVLGQQAQRLGLRLTVIGECMEGAGVTWSIDGATVAAPAAGFDHFR
jgi:thiamine-monophosphate kinase